MVKNAPKYEQYEEHHEQIVWIKALISSFISIFIWNQDYLYIGHFE